MRATLDLLAGGGPGMSPAAAAIMACRDPRADSGRSRRTAASGVEPGARSARKMDVPVRQASGRR